MIFHCHQGLIFQEISDETLSFFSLIGNEDDVRSAMGDNIGDEIFGAANIIQAPGAEPIEPQSFNDNHSVFSSGARSTAENDISEAMSMISLGSDASKVSFRHI